MNEKWGEMEQKGVKHHDGLPSICLHQAAGATDVPTQGFTQYSDEIKELTATTEQHAQLLMIHFPSTWQTHCVRFQIDEPICLLFGAAMLGPACYMLCII